MEAYLKIAVVSVIAVAIVYRVAFLRNAIFGIA